MADEVPPKDPTPRRRPKVSLVKLNAFEKLERMRIRQAVLREADYIVLQEWWRINRGE